MILHSFVPFLSLLQKSSKNLLVLRFFFETSPPKTPSFQCKFRNQWALFSYEIATQPFFKMNLGSTFQYLSTKNNFPSIKSIFKRSPLIFFLTLISFYVAKPTDIFSKIPLQNHWQFFLTFPTIAILVYILSWVILDALIPAYYKRNNWSNGKSFALKFLIAFLILLSFHFFNSLLNIHSSISFFLGIGLALSLFPALYFISLESQIPVNTETPVIPVFEDSDSELLFIETQSAHIKRWNQPQTRRPQVYAYYEKGEEVHLKLTKFDTLEDFILK